MKIENLTEFKNLFKKLNLANIFGENLEYHLINSNVEKWLEQLNESLSHSEPNQLCVIGLLVNHENDFNYINTIILVLRPSELKNDYLNYLSQFIHVNESSNGDTIIGFLRNHWESKPTGYPLTFLWTTYQNNTHISDIAVAPAYQKNGLMKTLSLALVEKLQTLYSKHHNITAITIHPATYLFFAPWDKDLQHYYPEEFQEITCKQILKYHSPAPQPISTLSTFVLKEETKTTLLQYGLLYRPTQYSQASLESKQQQSLKP